MDDNVPAEQVFSLQPEGKKGLQRKRWEHVENYTREKEYPTGEEQPHIY